MWFLAKKILGVGCPAHRRLLHEAGRSEDRRGRDSGKIALAKVNKDAKLELADHEIQVLRTKNADNSWKDEYVTVLVSMPIIVSALGSIVGVAFPEVGGRMGVAAAEIADIMTGETIDFAWLWGGVVSVSLGTKSLRK